MKDRIYYAIEYFVDAPIEIVSKEEEDILFVTKDGKEGKIERNYLGDWNIYLEGNLFYVIESSFFEKTFSDSLSDASEYYQDLKELEETELKPKTRIFLDGLIASTEYMLLFAPTVVPKKSVQVGPFFIYNLYGKKIINSLN
jgi:hypothetical protein